jgi:predicted Zn-dependent protease
MGRFLLRITGRQKDFPVPFLLSHPASEDRLAALIARRGPVTGPPLLSEAEWRALKRICRPG